MPERICSAPAESVWPRTISLGDSGERKATSTVVFLSSEFFFNGRLSFSCGLAPFVENDDFSGDSLLVAVLLCQ